MPFVDGVYTGLSNSFNNATNGTIIEASDWNALFTDIEDAFNDVATGVADDAPISYVIQLYNHEHFR